MKTKPLKSWAEFQSTVVDPFCKKDKANRPELWFRGQNDSSWTLRTTLDRFKSFASDRERRTFYKKLMSSFRDEIVGIEGATKVPDGDGLELLARHHGLPSSLIDWSRSPYVGGFFAFENAIRNLDSGNVAIWVLKTQSLDIGDEIQLVEDRKLLWYNRRALEQAGVFIRVNSIAKATEDFLGDALTKYEIPNSEARIAMRYFEAMNITAATLFRDLDGAARAVQTRTIL
jgi:FRG domain-containing protein